MRESFIESHLKLRVKEKGGYCFKLRFIGIIGAPDRLVLLHRKHFLVELKATDKKAAGHQSRMHRLLIWAGFKVYVINSIEGVEELLNGRRS